MVINKKTDRSNIWGLKLEKNYIYKAKFRNFGPVSRADITLRPLSIFIGPNNSGKTYVAYYMSELSKSILNTTGLRNIANLFYGFIQGKILPTLFKKKKMTLTFPQFRESKELKEAIDTFISDYTKSFPKDILNIDQEFPDSKVSLSTNWRLSEKRTTFFVPFEGKIEDFGVLYGVKKDGFSFEVIRPDVRKPRKNSKREKELIFRLLVLFLNYFDSCFASSLVLPAERTALTIAYKDIYKARAEGTFTHEGVELSRKGFQKYPSPIIRFLRFMYDLSEKSVTNAFELPISFLNENLLRGNISLEKKTREAMPSLFYSDKKRKVKVAIHGSSSGIKSITPLCLFLERAKPGQLLVIDEPEINLHPSAQLKLMEALAMAVNKGLYCLITTHSPYLVDHLNDLMLAHKKKKEGKNVGKALSKYSIPEDALIPSSMVSAYYFDEEGKATDIMDREEGLMDWESFSEVSIRLEDIMDDLQEL